jgi:hypothetical protein
MFSTERDLRDHIMEKIVFVSTFALFLEFTSVRCRDLEAASDKDENRGFH